ncbi:MAG: hypothetical protein ACT4P6_07605 [Gemmatimonadaceae bacterium]
MSKGLRSKVEGLKGLALALVAATGCAEHSQPSQIEPPAVRADGVVAYLVASPGNATNEFFVRAVTRRGVAVEELGSFVASVRLSSRGVSYVADGSDANALRVISPSDTALRVAGASPEGLASGELFALRLRASRATDLNGLRLEITELNDRSGVSLRPTLVVIAHVSWTR